MAVVPIWRFVGKRWIGAVRYISTVCLRGGAQVWSGNARLSQRSNFRPFCSSAACGNGRNLPGCDGVAFCDHYLVGDRAETVAICQAATAWHFATKCLVQVDWKWSEIARLLQPGISRPFFSGMAYKNGRDLPGCRTEANHDRFWVRWHGLCRLRGAQRLRGARRLQTSGACGGARRLRDARRLRGPIRRLWSARPGFRRRYSSRSNSSLGSRGRPE